jgi:alkylation response protein AidB-like acyl-CoA dehydrogenase
MCEAFSRLQGVTTSATSLHAPLDIDPVRLPALLKPVIEAERDRSDEIRKATPTLVGALRSAGAFRLLSPQELGGFELPLASALGIYEEFGRIDASTGLLVWNANFGLCAAYLPEAGVDRIWGDDPDPVIANSGRPLPAKPVEGGFRLTGRWDLLTGVDSAEWISLIAFVQDGDQPRLTDAGVLDLRVFFLPRDQVQVLDSWHTTGVRGSGSAGVVLDDVFVPDDSVLELGGPARLDGPLYRIPAASLVIPGCAAVVLGVARGAVDEVVRLVGEKRGMDGNLLSAQLRVQSAIAAADASLRAAKLLLLSAAGDLDTAAAAGSEPGLELRGALHAAMAHAGQVSREVLVAMYELGSSTSLYTGNRLEHVFRDGMAAMQHGNVAPMHFELAGRVLLGLDPASPIV